MNDPTGKEVKLGQRIHIYLNGMFPATIIDVREAPMVMGRKQVPPQVALQLTLQHIPGDGRNCGFYIVGDPEESAAVSYTHLTLPTNREV